MKRAQFFISTLFQILRNPIKQVNLTFHKTIRPRCLQNCGKVCTKTFTNRLRHYRIHVLSSLRVSVYYFSKVLQHPYCCCHFFDKKTASIEKLTVYGWWSILKVFTLCGLSSASTNFVRDCKIK